jgi:tungstate transport system substrate-binding protein
VRKAIAGLAMAAALAVGACGSGDRVLVAAGTTLVDSGLMASIADAYEQAAGTRLSVIGGSSAEVLQLLDRGEVVAGITHAPELEAEYVAAHPDSVATPVFQSEFFLVGPAGRTADLAGLDPVAALRAIAERGWTFVTRADGSGTYARELDLWRMAGLDPSGEDWYLETGQGMGATLQVADQREGFVLAEAGTFLGAELLDLVPVELNGDPALLVNPYTLIVDDPTSPTAAAFATWLVSVEGQRVVSQFGVDRFGRSLYVPP